uniref:Protein YIF1 n=1 Tax=Alona affinis TaxID=381656 RepID=A0A9N6WSQ8_9CRUS|nr:EOG090X0ATU [Alona affinis]
MPYPQYGYPQQGPPQPDPSSMYMPAPGGYGQVPGYSSPGAPQGGYGYPPQGQPMMMGADQSNNFGIPGQFLQNPAVANMALQYGQSMLGQTKDRIDQELNKYVSASRVKYYFSVDTAYVAKKLALILFPFTHRDWSVKYNPDEPVQPRYELNAPDLYIPAMAFVTYVLVGGVALGLQERFSPEVLGIQASTALVWAFLEVLATWVTLYVMNIQTKLSTFDILAFSSYKYVGMIVAIIVSFMMPSAYHFALIYVSLALMFFLVRSLKVQVLPESSPQQQDPYATHSGGDGSKRRTYLLLFMAGIQPVLIWWLTRHLAVPASSHPN